MAVWLIGVAVVALFVMLGVTIPALRRGRRASTVFTRRRAERLRREAERPVATASERVAADTRLRRLARPVRDALSGRRRVGVAEPEPVATAEPAPEPPYLDAAERAEASAERVARPDLGTPARGDEVAARRRAAQERIVAAAANPMALSVPGGIEEIDVDDVPEYFDFAQAGGDR